MTSSLSWSLVLLSLTAPGVASFATSPRGPRPSNIPSDAFVRDAEFKHGRVALVSGAVLSVLSEHGFAHPTAALAQAPVATQLLFFSALGVVEALVYLPRLSYTFSLKPGVVPGRVLPKNVVSTNALVEELELTAARGAMLFVLAYMLYDVATY